MKLVIDDLWSPDLNPPSSGTPADTASFEVLLQVAISEAGATGREVFSFMATSGDRLAAAAPGTFVSHVLVLDEFSWDAIRARIEKLLRHTESCAGWREAMLVLAGCLRASDNP